MDDQERIELEANSQNLLQAIRAKLGQCGVKPDDQEKIMGLVMDYGENEIELEALCNQ